MKLKTRYEFMRALDIVDANGGKKLTILELFKAIDEVCIILYKSLPYPLCNRRKKTFEFMIQKAASGIQERIEHNAKLALYEMEKIFEIIKSGKWTRSNSYRRIMCIYILSGLDINEFSKRMGISKSTALKKIDEMNTIISAYLISEGYNLVEDILERIYSESLLDWIIIEDNEDVPF